MEAEPPEQASSDETARERSRAELDAALDAGWSRVEAEWDDPRAHDKWIGLCAAMGRLELAGQRYRVVREADPERAERAQKSIDRVVVVAMQTLELAREPPPPSPKRVLLPVALLMTLALVGTALWVWLAAGR